MSNASIALLQGNTPKAPPMPATATEEDVIVNVDNMGGKALEALVVQHKIETPETWKKMKVDEKRAWLKTQFDEVEEEKAPEPVSDAPTNVTITKGSKKKPAEAAAKAPAKATAPAPVEAPVAEAATVPKATRKASTKAAPPAPAETAPVASTEVATTAKAKTGTISKAGDDKIADLVHEIENMKEKDARKAVSLLSDSNEFSNLKLGGVLSRIQSQNWFAPYGSFREYIEKEHGIKFRRAMYWVSIYNDLAESGVPWMSVADIGWTKLKEISSVLTPENVDEWVATAKAQTTIQLHETVVQAKKAASNANALEDVTKTVSTITFKVHGEQKDIFDAALDKAMKSSGTEVKAVAMEFICQDYLGGQTMIQKLQKMGLDKAADALAKAFPNADISISLNDEEADATTAEAA